MVAVMRLNEERVVWQEVDGEAVALDLVSSTYLSVNASGTVLLKALSTETSEEELAALLVDEYGLSKHEAETDVRDYVGDLKSRGLLHVDPS